MTVNEPTLIKKASDSSLDDVIHAQKQLDEELQQLKNRYSRYSQLVSYQQEEEDYLLKNKEKVNPKRVSLSLKKKKDVVSIIEFLLYIINKLFFNNIYII